MDHKIPLVLVLSGLLSTAALTQAEENVHTPPAGSSERQAIMDAMRLDFYAGDAEAAHGNAKKIVFKVLFLKVHGDWACAHVDPVDATGKEMAEPRWTLLQRQNGQWKDAHYFDALRPFESEGAAQGALEMNPATIRRVRSAFPDAPPDIFPKN